MVGARLSFDRLENKDGHLIFEPESQPKLADVALVTAHNCIW